MWLFDLSFVRQFFKSDIVARISRIISETPLDFKITRVDCNMYEFNKQSGIRKVFYIIHMLMLLFLFI